MARWDDNYKQGSFRGVEFKEQSYSETGGRRIVTNKYPERDKIDYDDLGDDEDVLSLDLYVIGDDVWEQREALKAALREPGPGNLVHPSLGTFEVVIDTWSCSERETVGRIAKFQVKCKVLKETLPQIIEIVETETLDDAVDDTLGSIQEQFEDTYSLATSGTTTINDASSTASTAIATASAVRQAVASIEEYKRRAKEDIADMASLISDPALIGPQLINSMTFGLGNPAAEDAKQLYTDQVEMINSMDTPFVETADAISSATAYPAKQIQNLSQLAALAGAAGLLQHIPYKTAAEATEYQTAVFDFIDTAMLSTEPTSNVFQSLQGLKRAVTAELSSEILALEREIDYTIKKTQPALVISYDVYGNIDREQEIVDRNQVQHPGFVTHYDPVLIRV